jgi:phage tail-like protein
MPETASRNDPFSAFNFLVEIDGVTVAGFSECAGLNAESDVIEYRVGSEESTMRKLPGMKKYTNITLKRGLTDNKDLWNWRKRVLDGRTQRQSGAVVLLNEARQPALRWTFREGWPAKWDGPSLNGKNNEVAIETLEIAHEGLVLE